jgi:hypothetical protein
MKPLFFGSIAVIAAKPQGALGARYLHLPVEAYGSSESDLLLTRSSNCNLVPVSLAAHR